MPAPNFRIFDYQGHRIQLEETPTLVGITWRVYVDRRAIAGRDTERLASDFAYGYVDRLVEDETLRPQLAKIVAARQDVRGFPFDPKTHEVGEPVWIMWRGAWRRGLVVTVRGGRVEVALMVDADSPKISRAWGKFADTRLAPI